MSFIPLKPEDSPWFSPAALPRLNEVREITSWKRPPGSHGCKLTEIVQGLWTAHFDDISDPDIFDRLKISPPIGLVVNSAIAYDQVPTKQGYYGPEIDVLTIDLHDDPKEGDQIKHLNLSTLLLLCRLFPTGDPHKSAGDAKKYFRLVNDSINEIIKNGKSAIVHCKASISRSAVFIIAYLMETKKLSAVEATALVKRKWDATYPNDSFVFQLLEFEDELKSSKPISRK